MLKPKALKKGDLVAVAAPASPFDAAIFRQSIKNMQKAGFKVTFRKDIFSKERYLAGPDRRRADELNQFFADPNVRAIFFARGGYGLQRILPLLDIEAIKANPKIVLGYSDITALHVFLNRHGIGGTFYGPNAGNMFKLASKRTYDLAIAAVTTDTALGMLPCNGAKTIRAGEAEGTLVGGCLSLIDSSIGTPYELPTDDAILFLEDVNEPVYRYDRMLTHLKAAGKLRNVKGIILGAMSLPKGEKAVWLKAMIVDVLGEFPGPIISDFPSGHLPPKKLFVTLPLGARAKMTCGRGRPSLEMLENAVVA
jgi:muramoyltetrapeptide carboxypeptidase